MLMTFALTVIALLLAIAAYWFWTRARVGEGQEAAAERVGSVASGESIDELAGLRNLQEIRNPITRNLCYQFWAAGIDLAPRTANLLMLVLAAIVVLFLVIDPLVGVLLALAIVAGGYLLIKQRVWRVAGKSPINCRIIWNTCSGR